MLCPICKRQVDESQPNPKGSSFPFCSERCKLIDLGKWAGGEYRVPTNEKPPEEIHKSNGNREDEE